MIFATLDFICKEINNYLQTKPDLNGADNAITLYNVSQLGSEGNSSNNRADVKAFLTLVNIEEDRISKSPENFVHNSNGTVVYKRPKVFLNLYLLFSLDLSLYEESLKQLSYIIQFFQYQNVFTLLTNPSLPSGIDELIFDLYTTSFQDLNNLWGILGSKYLPSVMYKMRLIVIDESFAQGGAGLISKISINDKTINQ